MKDPVITADGTTFERCAIQEWFSTGARTSPTTNEPLENLTLIPNHVCKRLINALMEERAPIVQLLSLLAAPLLAKMKLYY